MTAAEILRLLARQAELSEQFVAALEKGERLAPDVLDLERELEAIDGQLGEVPAERLRELADQVAGLEAERDRALADRRHTWEWYAQRHELLADLLRPTPYWKDAVEILANGSVYPDHPPTQAQLYHLLAHQARRNLRRAERAEREAARLHAALSGLMAAVAPVLQRSYPKISLGRCLGDCGGGPGRARASGICQRLIP